MTARIWEQCKPWMDSLITGETRLTADILWLADLQTSYPIEGSRLPKLGATNISVTVTIRRATPNAATSRLARLLDVPEHRSDRTDPSVGDAAAEGSDRALGDSAGSAAHRHLWGDSSAGADGECVSR